MDNISVGDYKSAIEKALSHRQIELLQLLYYFPDSTASARELAEVMNPTNPNPIVASGQVGKIGKSISLFLNIAPPTYWNGKKETPAFFMLVGPYFPNEGKPSGTRPGWAMEANLRTALEDLTLVTPESQKDYIPWHLPTDVLPLKE